MNTSLRFILNLVVCVLLTHLAAFAEGDTQVAIIEHITENGENEVIMPEELYNYLSVDTEVKNERPIRQAQPKTGRMAGYRVQVFSDNNVRTAKSEANNKARQIRAKFPQYQTHVMFTSPYWRLRVGDFRTQAEAQSAANLIRAAFPAMSKEIRVVKDRVNIVE